MHLKLIFKQDFDKIVSCKTLLHVSIIHAILILILYLTGIVQNWNTAPQAIAVSLTSSAAFREISAIAAVKQVQAQKQKKRIEKTNSKKANPVQKVPTKKTWKPLDITQITKPTETQVKEFKPVRQTTATNSVQEISALALATNLKKSLSSIRFGSSGTMQVNSIMLTYYDSISFFLYDKWKQPSKLAVSGSPPSVLVRLKIGVDGRLMGYQIIKNSNFPEMDNSVQQMLDTIDRLPPPPDGAITIEATFILTN